MSNSHRKKVQHFSMPNKIPYDDSPISRKGEIVKFPKIYPNKYEDNNLDNQIKIYKKNLKKDIQIEPNLKIKTEYFKEQKERKIEYSEKDKINNDVAEIRKEKNGDAKTLKQKFDLKISDNATEKVENQNGELIVASDEENKIIKNLSKDKVDERLKEVDFEKKAEEIEKREVLKTLNKKDEEKNITPKSSREENILEKSLTPEAINNNIIAQKQTTDLKNQISNNTEKSNNLKTTIEKFDKSENKKSKKQKSLKVNEKVADVNYKNKKNNVVVESGERSQVEINLKKDNKIPQEKSTKGDDLINLLSNDSNFEKPKAEQKLKKNEIEIAKTKKSDLKQIREISKSNISNKSNGNLKNVNETKQKINPEKADELKDVSKTEKSNEIKIVSKTENQENVKVESKSEEKKEKKTLNLKKSLFTEKIKKFLNNPNLVGNALFIASAVIFLINIILAGVLFYNVKTGGKKYIDINYNTITVNGNGISTSAVQSAWQSSVCVGAGGNVIDEDSFYTKTANRGSGVVFKFDENDNSAYVLTCNHVISGYESSIYVLFSCYLKPIKVSLVGVSIKYDIAVLKIKNVSNIIGLKPTTVADSRMLSLGESAFAIGNSLSSGLSVSNGIVSALNKQVNVENNIIREIQTDIAINPGNSGGGLFNSAGELIGIINAKLSTTSSSGSNTVVEGVSYAIPITFAVGLANSIIRNNGSATFIDLGISLSHSEKYVSMTYVNGKYIETYEVRVSEISSDSCAKGLLKQSDIIKSITYVDFKGETKTVKMYNEFSYEDICFDIKEGSNITFSVSRPLFNEEKTITVKAENVATLK